MAIEHARVRALAKPWGVMDLHPFSNLTHGDERIGEIWYERESESAATPSLLLKLLFTSQPLSIQVHPDDVYARSMGQRNGKTEGWYVLNAGPDAKIALGLKENLTAQQLREAIDDGSISDLVVWHAAFAGDVFLVPAGTIHAIGAGLVIAEIQQRSDATFRIFDYGRKRELHVDRAVAVANAGPADFKLEQVRLSPERVQAICDLHFGLEHIELAPHSTWHFQTDRETWLLAVNGEARAGSVDMSNGDAIFVDQDSVDIHVGARGLIALAAYAGAGLMPNLFKPAGQDRNWRTSPKVASASTTTRQPRAILQ